MISYNIVWCGMVWCGMVCYDMALYGAISPFGWILIILYCGAVCTVAVCTLRCGIRVGFPLQEGGKGERSASRASEWAWLRLHIVPTSIPVFIASVLTNSLAHNIIPGIYQVRCYLSMPVSIQPCVSCVEQVIQYHLITLTLRPWPSSTSVSVSTPWLSTHLEQRVCVPGVHCVHYACPLLAVAYRALFVAPMHLW